MRSSAKGLDEILASPWALWAISLAAALTMWYYVADVEDIDEVTRKFTCPLEYRALDPQSALRRRVSEVDVEIRGRERDIARLDFDAVTCFVDARNLTPGKRYAQNVNVTLPSGIELVSCVPSQVVVDLVRQVVRLMPVEVVLPQDIPEGHYLKDVEVLPRDVAVRGAEGDIAKVGALRAAPTVEELRSGRALFLPVRFAQSEPFDDAVTLEPSQVRVMGTLARGLPRKRVPIDVRLSGQLDEDREIRSIVTDPSEAQLEGPAELLEKIATVETETVDISLLSSDQTVVVPLIQPDVEGVSLSGGRSVHLSLHLGAARAVKQLVDVPVEVRGAGDQHWAIAPPSVAVTIQGPPSKIRDTGPGGEGLKAWVDLTNIFVAPVTLPVRTDVIAGDIEVVKVDPPTVTADMSERSGRW